MQYCTSSNKNVHNEKKNVAHYAISWLWLSASLPASLAWVVPVGNKTAAALSKGNLKHLVSTAHT